MSHAPERAQKTCLNCGTIVVGRFCHVCGQENVEPKESVWHLVSHFFNDITHFDGKFFQTVKVLLFRPGFLSRQYVEGKRASYLNPVRMYVFTSAIFFLVFFSFLQLERSVIQTIHGKTLEQINQMDSTSFAAFTAAISDNHRPMTREAFRKFADTTFGTGLHFNGADFKSAEEYDSALASGKRHDNWFERHLIHKQIEINQKYNNNSQQVLVALFHAALHSLPQMLFVSLPLLALILQLFYVRRKQFYYVSHGIFSIHLYVFIFLMLLILFSLSRINERLHWNFIGLISTLLTIGIFVYEYFALKNFYSQGWIKTFFKFLLVDLFFLILLALLAVVFAFFSFFNI